MNEKTVRFVFTPESGKPLSLTGCVELDSDTSIRLRIMSGWRKLKGADFSTAFIALGRAAGLDMMQAELLHVTLYPVLQYAISLYRKVTR